MSGIWGQYISPKTHVGHFPLEMTEMANGCVTLTILETSRGGRVYIANF